MIDDDAGNIRIGSIIDYEDEGRTYRAEVIGFELGAKIRVRIELYDGSVILVTLTKDNTKIVRY